MPCSALKVPISFAIIGSMLIEYVSECSATIHLDFREQLTIILRDCTEY